MVKRLIIAILATALITYGVAYGMLAGRRSGHFRNAGVFAHIREFQHDWQGRVFYPAAAVEWTIIAVYPRPFLPNPSWSSVPQVMVIETPSYKTTVPPHALKLGT